MSSGLGADTGLVAVVCAKVSGVTVGDDGFEETGGLDGLYLRSNGFPVDCPQAIEVQANNMAIPRMRIMGAKVATSMELNYLLHVSLSKMDVSPATSRPADVPVEAQMVFPV